MILDISYSNIRVFHNEMSFSMEATDSMEKRDNVMNIKLPFGNIDVLKIGAIYGPNGSGKTTIMSVMFYLRNWLLNTPTNYFNDFIAPFALDNYSSYNPSKLTIRFFTAGLLMRYSVEFFQGKCAGEVLECRENSDYKLLFKRITSKSDKHTVTYGSSIIDKGVPVMEIASDKSVLALFNNMSLHPISDAARYLTSIEIANSYNSTMKEILFAQVRPWINRNGNRSRLVDFINCFDINIKDLLIPQKSESTSQDIKYIHPVRNREGVVIKDSQFRASLESTGTNVLALLGAKVLQALDEGRPIMIDELDSGFHTEVTRTVIDMFRDPEINKHGAQLILTTHNVKLMDERTLRKDQVWFIQKNDRGESELFSLAEFDEVGEYDNFSQWYLAKRFGAVPNPSILKIRRLFHP